MGNTYWFLGIIVIMFYLPACSNTVETTKSTRGKSDKWSESQGKMNWTDAKAKCVSLGMKLPTVQEFAEAEKNGTTKAWEQKGYWTSNDASENYAYSFNVQDRSIVGSEKIFQWRVICTR